ncbi:flavin reductase domain-containing protein [Acetobacter estunensis NRIC 0472]|uniref:Flavin reductase n=1 Tax=Acetobacter estunensis TaxID=104097 RepID=A0A967B2A0_9PROT|nr:flavin reductase family protein [Acetobacter estunensis]NHO52400.1 flavin reductase [Acetobacter estunensis]GBQ25883.1 flavin reductase domain-containing protein [Acetobacter estunensis NRIC 0472]
MSGLVATAIDPTHLREVVGAYVSGLTIVTSRLPGGELVGMTCQSFHSLSLNPPLVAFFAGRHSKSYAALRSAGGYVINVLAADQKALALQFARSSGDKWAGVKFHDDAAGLPRLDGAIAHISCSQAAEYPGGDHMIAVGQVRELAHDPAKRPLLFFRSDFHRLYVAEE